MTHLQTCFRDADSIGRDVVSKSTFSFGYAQHVKHGAPCQDAYDKRIVIYLGSIVNSTSFYKVCLCVGVPIYIHVCATVNAQSDDGIENM